MSTLREREASATLTDEVPVVAPKGVVDVVAIMLHLPDNRVATRHDLIRAFALAAPSPAEGAV